MTESTPDPDRTEDVEDPAPDAVDDTGDADELAGEDVDDDELDDDDEDQADEDTSGA